MSIKYSSYMKSEFIVNHNNQEVLVLYDVNGVFQFASVGTHRLESHLIPDEEGVLYWKRNETLNDEKHTVMEARYIHLPEIKLFVPYLLFQSNEHGKYESHPQFNDYLLLTKEEVNLLSEWRLKKPKDIKFMVTDEKGYPMFFSTTPGAEQFCYAQAYPQYVMEDDDNRHCSEVYQFEEALELIGRSRAFRKLKGFEILGYRLFPVKI